MKKLNEEVQEEIAALIKSELAERRQRDRTEEEIQQDREKCYEALLQAKEHVPCWRCGGTINGFFRRDGTRRRLEEDAEGGRFDIKFFIKLMKQLTPACADCAEAALGNDSIYDLNDRIGKLEYRLSRSKRSPQQFAMFRELRSLQKKLFEKAQAEPLISKGVKLRLPPGWLDQVPSPARGQ